MGMYEFDLVLLLLQQMCVFLVIAQLMGKTWLFISLMQITIHLPHRLLYYVTSSIFCIMGTYLGLHIEGPIANTHATDAVVGGLPGGPVIGGLVGLTDDLHRYSLGGMIALSCMVSTIIKGLLSGLIHSMPVKCGRPDKVFSPLTAGTITFVIEPVRIMIIPLTVRLFQDAPHLVQSIVAPMMVTNTVGAALLIHILLDKRAMFEKYTFTFPATALKVAASTEGILRQRFNGENNIKATQVLTQELDIGAVTITDRDKLLAFTGIDDDHHLPGKPISSSYTQWAIKTGEAVYVGGDEVLYRRSIHLHCKLGSTLVTLSYGENRRVIGTIKLYEAKNRLFSSINHTLGKGTAQLLSAQILAGQYERQKALLMQSEVKFLHAQINPHFLFNTPSTLKAVVRRDSDQANQLVQYLSTFFRKNLKRLMKTVTPANEIEHVNAYLQVEKARLQANLQTQIAIPEGLVYHQLPTFILRPIVENAIKHGTSQHLDVGEITIRASQDDRWLQLDTEDNAGLYWANPQAGGLGMNLVDRRLWACLGVDCGISVTCESERFTHVTLRLPLEENAC